MNLLELSRKTKLIIIGVLLFLILILIIGILFFTKKTTPITPTPSGQTPATMVSPKPQLPVAVQEEFRYPIQFENIGVILRPKSSTFVVYYQGDISAAQLSFNQLMRKYNLLPSDFNVDFRSTDPITPPIHVYK